MTVPIDSLPSLHGGPDCDAELVVWRLPAGPRVTVIAKIAFAVEPGVAKKLLPAIDLVDRDRHYDRSPLRSIEAASDLAPLMPGAEVLVVGHAYAARGRATSLIAQVQIARKEVVQLRKRIHGASPAPIDKMPLRWELALRTAENPVGVDASEGAPSLVHAADPSIAAGLGPIAADWPVRAARLQGLSPSRLDATPLELPAGFDFNYFRAAPEDQQLPALKGDEWVALDGLHPALPRVEMRLPGALVVARFVQPKGKPIKVLPLLPDRLVVDTDRQIATLTYRAGFAIDWTTLAKHRVEIGIAAGDQTLRFPDHHDPASLRGHSRRAMRAAAPATGSSGTTDLTDAIAEPDLPFKAEREARVPPPIPIEPRSRRFMASGLDEPTVDTPFPFGAPEPATPPPMEVKLPSVHPPPPLARPTEDELLSTLTVDTDFSGPAPVPFPGAVPAGESKPSAPGRGLPFESDDVSMGEATGAAAPERGGDTVPIVTDTALDVTAFPWQLTPPRDCLIVVVKASFDLVPGEPARLRSEAATLLGDVFAGDEPDTALLHADDFAISKPEVDVLLEGTAYAPGGSATAMQISMRLRGAGGAIDRAIAVFGDRVWQGGALQLGQSEPAPFQSIPITYQRAFGGAGFADNPNGLGYRGAAGADGVRRLPNFEQMGELVASPSDTPAPQSFSGIHPLWPARAALLGTYDKAWFETRWPYFPADLDPRAFQAAPPEQRLPFVRGDEAYELGGVHPAHARLRGELPGLRARVFIQRTPEGGGTFEEVPVRLDTVTFTPDDDALHLLFRGSVEVTDDDAPELAHIFATLEPVAGPALTLDEARARYLATIADPRAEDADILDTSAGAETTEDDDAEARKIEAEIAAHEAHIRAMHGPDALGDERESIELSPPDLGEIAAAMREAGAEEADIEELTAALQPPGTEPPPPPEPDLRELVIRRMEEGEPLSALDLQNADLRGLNLSAQSLQGSDLTGANLDGADLTSCDASQTVFAGASLVGATLAEALLTEADLTGADISGANARRALLDGAEARGLKARGADLAEAMIAGAVLAESDLTEAKLDGADMSATDLSGSTLDRASFKNGTLAAARLYEAKAVSATFDRAEMTNARAEGGVFERCSFREIVANESIWEKAVVSGSIFFGAELREASFVRATCEKTLFSEADMSHSRLRKARLTGAIFVRANLLEAACDRASFEGADLRAANLHGASLTRASLKGAKLDGALTTYSLLDRRQPV